MVGNDAVGESQPQSAAVDTGALAAEKASRHVTYFLGRYADASVRHINLHRMVDKRSADRDLSFFLRIADGVVDNIVERETNRGTICADEGQAGRDVDVDLESTAVE